MLNYERRGAGEPLLLLHGIGHRWQAWEPVLDRLAREHDVIAIDLPGFGRSPLPPAGLPGSVRGIAAFLRAWCERELGLGSFHVAGNSMGGGLALELAKTGAALSATAISPAGFSSPAEGRRALTILLGLRAATLLPEPVLRLSTATATTRAAFYSALMTCPAALDSARLVGDALALRRCAGFVPAARALASYGFSGAPTVPVTVAWGEHDHILQPHQAALAKVRLPQARHLGLPGCGHVPMGDSPDLVAEVILHTTQPARVWNE